MFGTGVASSYRPRKTGVAHEPSLQTQRAGSRVPRASRIHRRNCAHPKHGMLSKVVMRLAGDDLAVRRSFRASFFFPATIFLVFATIVIAAIFHTSANAIQGSARDPGPAPAQRGFARGGGAQSQSKKAGSGEGQGVYRS